VKDLKKRIGNMFWLIIAFFVIMAGYFVYVAAFEAEDFIANPFNARVRVHDESVRRGSIYDRHGTVIAYSAQIDGAYVRQYQFGSAFAHAVGYSAMGRSGLELSRNFSLQTMQWELVQRGNHAIFGNEILANSVVTTLDADLQNMIFEALGNSRGAVVAIDPNTGAILAMVSTPGFHPEYVEDNWVGLINDTENSPLLNRATQGLYPPGSTFKIITAAAALHMDIDFINFEFHCEGVVVIGENALPCWGGVAHGAVDMRRATAVSCNGYFAVLAQEIGADAIITAAEMSLFNNAIEFELATATSLFNMQTDAATTELIETAIGQGRTTATPLNMAMLAAAIANGGVAMRPYVVEGIAGSRGNTISTTVPRLAGRLVEPEIAAIIGEMLVEAVNNGTGAPAAVANMQAAGKTGTAQNETGIDHSWFIGYAPAENPTVAVAVIIENTGGGTRASQLAGRIFAEIAAE